MKLEKLTWLKSSRGETLAIFGEARIARHLDGHFELSGGTKADHAEAREWCALFMPEVLRQLDSPDGRGGRRRCPALAPNPGETLFEQIRPGTV